MTVSVLPAAAEQRAAVGGAVATTNDSAMLQFSMSGPKLEPEKRLALECPDWRLLGGDHEHGELDPAHGAMGSTAR